MNNAVVEPEPSDAAPVAVAETPGDMNRVVFAGMIGNGLEWYDYALYGQVAGVLGKLFFPQGNEFATMLNVYGIFALGFVVRPAGAIFFGWLGDKYGRRSAMVAAVLMMAIPTGCIGLLPTYDQIGYAAPIALALIRLVQGLSLGGEFSGSIAYTVEHAPPNRRGWVGVASVVSLVLGFLVGVLAVKAGMYTLGKSQFEAWGWRVPFLFGIAIGVVGFYIRNHCSESPLYLKARAEGTLSKKPVRDALFQHPWEMAQGFLIYISLTMPFYLTTIYFIGFSEKYLKVGNEQAIDFSIYNMIALLVVMPFTAWLSDNIGRKAVMGGTLIVMMAAVYPIFLMMYPGAPLFQIGLAQVLLALILSSYLGPFSAMIVELFPTSVRFTGMSIAYNLPAMIFGGTAPAVCGYLLNKTGTPQSIAIYVMFCNALSLTAFYFYKERFREPLRQS